MTADIAAVTGLLAQVDLGRLEGAVLVGGLARSGTSFADALVAAHPGVLAFDEFMPLKTAAFPAMLLTLKETLANDRAVWRDRFGRTWRGFGPEGDHLRVVWAFLSCLGSTTPLARLAGKDPGAATHIFCKTPSSEFHVAALADALRPLAVRYVHCVRDPIVCARSNWEMPWVRETDPGRWSDDFAAALNASRLAVARVRAAGVPTHVLRSDRLWDPETASAEVKALESFIGLPFTAGQHAFAHSGRVDPWPRERRRVPPARFDDACATALSARPEIAAWRQAFGMPA